jgi:D-alanyl-D-alanine dipeptidase
MDKASHPLNKKDVSLTAYQNRMLLRHLMQRYGFAPYAKEWWHFTLINEPYKNTYFNFPIKPMHDGSG